MPYENIWEERGVYIRFTGVVTSGEVQRSNEELYRDPRFFSAMDYQIADFLSCNSIQAEPEEVRLIASLDAEMSRRHPGVRVAIVTTTQVIYGYSRMYQLCTEQSHWETEIFDSLAAARTWIKQAPPPNSQPV